MEARRIYKDISKRTGGDIYIGVVGPVRCGKSTFINRFMETAIIPNIKGDYDKKKARDELPQSADGKTVMTAEPKFIPDEAVEISFGDTATARMRMIDCVGYLIPDALGMTENGEMRMVKTPWSNEPIPFEEAAEQGTQKVMREHSTLGMVITCDGSFGEIPRESYVEAEKRIIKEMKSIGKPFVTILNSAVPDSQEAEDIALKLEKEYSCPVALLNCQKLDMTDIESIFELLLYEFPVTEIDVDLPLWTSAIPETHNVITTLNSCIKEMAGVVRTLSDVKAFSEGLDALLKSSFAVGDKERECSAYVKSTDLSTGKVRVCVDLPQALYYSVICDITGLTISGQSELIKVLCDLADARRELDKYREAIDKLESIGYGIVMPKMEDLELSEPEVIKNSGSYGVKLCAKAESIHMIRAEIETEINPIVGTQEQAEEIIQRLITEYSEDPARLWESNIFGKSLYELVNDGLNTKIRHLSDQSKEKISDTLSRIVNESSNGLICILL
ncbi:MAG: stage IV sporulation protein A [Clostridia bacterium]|nr:stage IV sporulation protein A [Clostridia bacterium]